MVVADDDRRSIRSMLGKKSADHLFEYIIVNAIDDIVIGIISEGIHFDAAFGPCQTWRGTGPDLERYKRPSTSADDPGCADDHQKTVRRDLRSAASIQGRNICCSDQRSFRFLLWVDDGKEINCQATNRPEYEQDKDRPFPVPILFMHFIKRYDNQRSRH